MNKRLLLPILLACFVFTGCGIQMPVTEGLVFSSDEPYGQSNEVIFPNLDIRVAATVGSTSRITATSQLRDAAVDESGSAMNNELDGSFLNGPGYPGFAASFGNGRRFAVAFTPGIFLAGMHVDATVRTVEKVFFTVNQNIINNGTELILQRPVYEVNNGGISIGAFFRSERIQFKDQNSIFGEPTFRIEWFGARVMAQSPNINGAGFHLRGFLNVGMVPEFDAPLVGLGIGVTID